MLSYRFLAILIIINFCISRKDVHHEYTIKADNKQFLALIYLKEKIQITLTETGVISSSYFFTELTLESLCKYNKIFKQYDTLEDAYDCIIKLFEKEKIRIYNYNDKFSLGFIMNSASCDNEEVIIKFEEKKMKKEEIDENIRMEINNLRKQIKILIKENHELKEKNKDFELRLDYLELKDEKIDTKIITKKSEITIIKKEFEEKYKKSDIKFNLLYRASRDGNQYNNMNSRIRYNNNIIMLFHTIKGIKFGVFLYEGLNNNYRNNNGNNYSINPKSFIFSLERKKIFYIENENKIICFSNKCPTDKQEKDYLINIYSSNILAEDKRMNFINNISNLSGNEINAGDKYFNLQEFEIFQVSYVNNPKNNKQESIHTHSSSYSFYY